MGAQGRAEGEPSDRRQGAARSRSAGLSPHRRRRGGARRPWRTRGGDPQYDALEAFWRRWFKDDAGFLAGYGRYSDPGTFNRKLEAGLRKLIERRIDRRVEQRYFAIDGKQILRAGATSVYDERDDMVEIRYVGIDGEPVPGNLGYARVTRRYDERRNMVEEETYFGVDAAPPVRDIARVIVENDPGIIKSGSFRRMHSDSRRCLSHWGRGSARSDTATIPRMTRSARRTIRAASSRRKLSGHGSATTTYEVPQGRLGVNISDVLAARQSTDATLPPPP